MMALARRACARGAASAPRGGRVDVPGALAVLPRESWTTSLARAARARRRAAAGAGCASRRRCSTASRVVGARLQAAATARTRSRARWVVLATGAAPQALIAAGMCERRTPSGVALRGYVRNPAHGRAHHAAARSSGTRACAGGYGWIFPGAGRRVQHRRRPHRQPCQCSATASGAMQDVNLREHVRRLLRGLRAGARADGRRRAASASSRARRCAARCDGARWSRPGLLVTGEAAGSTYAFTGEGIGKAMETGLLAAEALIAGRHGRRRRGARALRGRAAGAEAALRALREGQPRQPPPLAGRPA
ncbi:MAG: hypothetical protein MZW92_04575 [Comamonadaceae bacterium]|nr:hypothetical protein [Comamonadaceae bacterium]